MKHQRIEKEIKRREKKFWNETKQRIETLKFLHRKINESKKISDTGIELERDD